MDKLKCRRHLGMAECFRVGRGCLRLIWVEHDSGLLLMVKGTD